MSPNAAPPARITAAHPALPGQQRASYTRLRLRASLIEADSKPCRSRSTGNAVNAATFDTHAAVKALREAGADERMAEAIVNTASAAAGAGHGELATKADLRTAINPLATKADLNAATASVRAELGTIRWSTGLLAAFMFAIGLRMFGIL